MDNASKMLCAAGATLPEPTPSTATSSRNHPGRRPTRSTSKLLGSKASSSASPTIPPKRSKSEPFVCPICFDDSPDLHTLSLDCDHLFCSVCWTAYLTSKIREEAEHAIRCMAEGCALIAPDSFIHSVLVPENSTLSASLSPSEVAGNEATWSRFQELLVRHYVACNPSLKFCPYPSCTNTVSCPAAASKASLATVVPTVSCGVRGVGGQSSQQSQSSQGQIKSTSGASIAAKEHLFCFGCPVESDHRPVVCGVAALWLKKCRDDSETANWIKSNTKECSHCQSTIEKNGGCK